MPFLAEITVPWIIVAMIFISFLRFIMNRVKGPATLEQEPEDSQWPNSSPPPTPQDQPPPPISAAEEFRRFFETLREGEPDPASLSPAPPPVRPHHPPPAPPAPPPTPREPRKLSETQKKAAAAFRLHSQSPSKSLAKSRNAPSKAKPKSSTSPALISLLKDPASVRQAIVMREVLGPPLALRDREDSWS